MKACETHKTLLAGDPISIDGRSDKFLPFAFVSVVVLEGSVNMLTFQYCHHNLQYPE